MSTNLTDRQQFGHAGFVVLADTARLVVKGHTIEFLEDTVIASLEDSNGDYQGVDLDEITWKEGRFLFNRFEAITLVGGSCIIYKREN